MRFKNILSMLAAGALCLSSVAATAQTTVTDQNPAPAPSATNQATPGQSELLLQSQAITGGTLYTSILKQPGLGGAPIGNALAFVPTAASGLQRYLNLIDGHSDAGVPMTATPGTPSGTVGVSRTAGTSLVLTGEATSSSAKTDKVIWQTNLPSSYVANASVPVVVNANYATSGTVTAANTTITVAAYTEVNGVETALTVSAAQQFTATAANYTFTVTGTGLTPGANVVIEVVMLVTTSAGAATGQINSVSYTA